jgi:hypothetical protein
MTHAVSATSRSSTDNFQLLWILFSDANSRFNTLIEECAHLQDTILSLTACPELIDDIIADTRTHDSVEGFTRPVSCLPRGHAKYYAVPVRDRALLSLWMLLGGLVVSLDKNQQRHRKAFEAAVSKMWLSDSGGDHLFWYVATRGYFLTSGFKHYTTQLEHAHEKLIQMLENQPGTLPNPILMRRWNSGMYGEFLSEYSRHVNWEARTLTRRITKSANSDLDLSITHTWTHQPTSMAQYFDVNHRLKAGVTEPSTKHRYATIKSAYFYMEQPVLLPLLYHECVHISFPDTPSRDHKDFFGAREAAIRSLRLIKFPDTVDVHRFGNFWEQFTEEVWADALSIALGGRGYLAALALQLIGLSGEDSFDHYDVAGDMLVPPDEFGDFSRRKHPIPYPSLDLPFFWEARLLIACRLLQLRQAARGTEAIPAPPGSDLPLDDVSLASSIERLIKEYYASGKKSYSREGTSRRHEDLWTYRRDLNEWVVKTTMMYLEEPFIVAADHSQVCSTYDLNIPAVRECIQSNVNGYRRNYLHGKSNDLSGFQLSCNQRLEDLSIDIRWKLSSDVCAAIARDASSLSLWTSNFANWMRHDGGAPFRIALEASRLRLSLFDGVADGLGEKLPDVQTLSIEAGTVPPTIRDSRIWNRLTRPAGGECWDYFSKDPELVTNLFRRRQVTNSSRFQAHYPQEYSYVKEVELIVGEAMTNLSRYITDRGGNPQQPLVAPEASVGTVTLGVLRPDSFARCLGDESPYLVGMSQTSDLFRHAFEEHRRLANAESEGDYLSRPADLDFAFNALLGEYQFLSFLKGSTPVERDFHPSHQCAGNVSEYVGSRHLIKPRMTLQVAGAELSGAMSRNSATHWGRVALIRFKYRWQWLELMQQLNLRSSSLGIDEYSLVLSSAWEDVMLFTWHKEPDSLWRHRELGLKPGVEFGVDIQSAYSVPTQHVKVTRAIEVEGESWESELFMNWARASAHVHKVYTRSGRFDYTVVWKDTHGQDHSLANCAKGLAEIPPKVWQQISSFISSYEQRSYDSKQRESNIEKCKTVTHFAIKNRLASRPFMSTESLLGGS